MARQGTGDPIRFCLCKKNTQVSHEKKWPHFPWNPGCLIGILVKLCDNPHVVRSTIPYISSTTRVFFIAQVMSFWTKYVQYIYNLDLKKHTFFCAWKFVLVIMKSVRLSIFCSSRIVANKGAYRHVWNVRAFAQMCARCAPWAWLVSKL